MKRLISIATVFTLLMVSQAAHAVYLNSSWYATLSNVTYSNGTPFTTGAGGSSHISVTASAGNASFTVPQSGQAVYGEQALWQTPLVLGNSHLIGISFDYQTFWTQPNLVLELWTASLDDPQGSGKVWSSASTGHRSGHVVIDAYPQVYTFTLVAVPEPSSLLSLGTICLAGVLMRPRRSSRRLH